MTPDVDCIVIGAGAVGLAIARQLSETGRDVIVLERHKLIGSEISSRNSEVIHGGLYYPPGSLRAKFCVSGKQALYTFCQDNGVRFERCGKLLIAADDAQVVKLKSIAVTAARWLLEAKS